MARRRYDFARIEQPSALLRVRHEPGRRIQELAEEFGIHYLTLAKIIAHDPTAPKPLQAVGNRKYYPIVSMRKWWAARSPAA